jgi:hypothetical protein
VKGKKYLLLWSAAAVKTTPFVLERKQIKILCCVQYYAVFLFDIKFCVILNWFLYVIHNNLQDAEKIFSRVKNMRAVSIPGQERINCPKLLDIVSLLLACNLKIIENRSKVYTNYTESDACARKRLELKNCANYRESFNNSISKLRTSNLRTAAETHATQFAWLCSGHNFNTVQNKTYIFVLDSSRLPLRIIPAAGRGNAESLAWIIGGPRLD